MKDAQNDGALPNGLRSVFEVAQILGVNPESVRRYIREKKLHATKVRTIGLREQWGVSDADLEAFRGR
ncbi:MAG: helix-turn-helix domain-containing protein [Chromatiaceae bacterium]|nr:helix-turn-helix domain-containing protein [Gammaproteobacteria bacterium]MCP5407924.1 helix-turn-helix domain-containing protein [Chromatiaceae bacterium]